SVMAVSRVRVGFGAFPLAIAGILLACVVSRKRTLQGLVTVAIVLGVVTVVRALGILVDGTAAEAVKLLRVEAIVWAVSMAGIGLEVARSRRPEAGEPRATTVRVERPTRYHPILVALHWGLALFIVAALVLGMFVLKEIPNSSPDKLEALRAHMLGGMAILALMIARLVVRLSTARPERATTGVPALDRLAAISHYGFYGLVILMAGTGLATAYLADLFRIVLGHSGAPLPESFLAFPTRVLHGYIAKLLAGLIALHVAAALYHQYGRKDGLLGRMAFGRRSPRPSSRTGARRALQA
ncbi:MAG TPA: cytochrome b/b6 domain-containing protein, partial [Usitatibacter sp.]|nr:cytochrome b/b6 domain-containing protein [Usitatibacter sp.]